MYVLSIIICHFVLFLLAIVLSILHRYTVSDYPVGIFKLFLVILFPDNVNCGLALLFLFFYILTIKDIVVFFFYKI
jgi:hypothetical protein